jgi:HEAT repeats
MKWKKCGFSLALFTGLSPLAIAQVPGVPAAPAALPGAAVPGAAGPLAGPATTAPGAAAPRNIWSFLCPAPDQFLAKKLKFCESQFGKLINNSLQPMGALTGGVLGPCCPTVNPADLLAPPDSAVGAAAQIMADEAAAKKRRAAVHYLGTVDCNYWPEAQAALINALRADRNVCVRLEAAWALGRGCCCNRATMTALALTVEGSRADGNPAETSECVRAAAHAALEHCLAVYAEVEKLPLKPAPVGPEPRPGPGLRTEKKEPERTRTAAAKPKGPITPAAFYHKVKALPQQEVVQHARKVIDKSAFAVGIPSSDRSLLGILRHAWGSRNVPGPEETYEPLPAAEPAVVLQQVPVAPASPFSHGQPAARMPSPATQPVAPASMGLPAQPVSGPMPVGPTRSPAVSPHPEQMPHTTSAPRSPVVLAGGQMPVRQETEPVSPVQYPSSEAPQAQPVPTPGYQAMPSGPQGMTTPAEAPVSPAHRCPSVAPPRPSLFDAIRTRREQAKVVVPGSTVYYPLDQTGGEPRGPGDATPTCSHPEAASHPSADATYQMPAHVGPETHHASPAHSTPYSAVVTTPSPTYTQIPAGSASGAWVSGYSPYTTGKSQSVAPRPMPSSRAPAVLPTMTGVGTAVPEPNPDLLPAPAPEAVHPVIVLKAKPMAAAVSTSKAQKPPAVTLSRPQLSLTQLNQAVRYSESANERAAAVVQLAEVKDRSAQEVVPIILAATEDLVPSVRETALWALERIGTKDPDVLEAVRQLTHDSDEAVRARAQRLLGG